MTELKRIRTAKRMTQQEAAAIIGVSLRSYVTYENDESKSLTAKYRFLLQEIAKINPIDEEHGVLTRDDILTVCRDIFPEYEVEYCYLFGSYAKGTATGSSDIDLLISAKITGLKYYELAEKLREGLHKRVDLLNHKQLLNNEELLNEVLKYGVRIYG